MRQSVVLLRATQPRGTVLGSFATLHDLPKRLWTASTGSRDCRQGCWTRRLPPRTLDFFDFRSDTLLENTKVRRNFLEIFDLGRILQHSPLWYLFSPKAGPITPRATLPDAVHARIRSKLNGGGFPSMHLSVDMAYPTSDLLRWFPLHRSIFI